MSMRTMKKSLLQLLLLTLCAMHATSSPMESVVPKQLAEEPSSRQPTVVAVASGAMQAAGMAAGDKAAAGAEVGAEHGVDAMLLMPLLPADELPTRDAKCAKIGEYCTLADMCCTKRCLTFAAKCVT